MKEGKSSGSVTLAAARPTRISGSHSGIQLFHFVTSRLSRSEFSCMYVCILSTIFPLVIYLTQKRLRYLLSITQYQR